MTVTAPTNGATVSGTINASANATDNVGVTRVEFLRDGIVFGQDTTSPYSMSFNTTTVTNGSHTFGARAYDAAGNIGNATNVTVTVSNVAADTVAPTVAVTAPTNGATVSGTINATANATDAVGVTRVEFLRDGTVFGQDTTSPYSISVNTTTVTNGSHTFGARAYDAAGNIGNATNVTATVSNVAPTTGCAVSTANVPDGPDGSGGCWPGPANTGPPAGTTLTNYTGSCTLSSGTYDARTFNCDMNITGTVTITRSRVNGSIQVASTGNLTISDSYVDASPNGPRETRAIWADEGNTTITRAELVGGNGTVWCSPCTIRDSYVHGQEIQDPWHASAVRADQNSTVIHNSLWCEAQPIGSEGGCSADLTGYPDFQPTHHWTIERNLFMANSTGNAFCAYGGGTSGKPYSNDPQNATYIVFRDNVFQRGANNKCASFAPIDSFMSGRTGNVWSNNKFDNGTAVNP